MKEINGNKETLKRNLLDLIELQYILHKTQVFFQEVRVGREEGGGRSSEGGEGGGRSSEGEEGGGRREEQ